MTSGSPTSRYVLPLAGLIGFFVLWGFTWRIGWLPKESIPSPSATARELVKLVGEPKFWQQLRQTGVSWAVGLLVAAAIAVPLGLLVGSSALAVRLTRVTIEALRPIPPVVVLPLALLVLGGGLSFKVALIAQGAVWPLFIQTTYGVRNTDPVALDTARSFQLGTARRLLQVRLPSAATTMATGLRLAAATAFAVCLVTELVGGARGLGAGMLIAQTGGNVARLLALTVVAGIFGMVIATVFGLVEKRLTRWAPKVAG